MTLENTLRYLANFRATLLVMSIVAFGAAVFAGLEATGSERIEDRGFADFVDGAGPLLILCGLLVVARSVVTIAHVMALTAIGGESDGPAEKPVGAKE